VFGIVSRFGRLRGRGFQIANARCEHRLIKHWLDQFGFSVIPAIAEEVIVAIKRHAVCA
jgi:hypothetical protein